MNNLRLRQYKPAMTGWSGGEERGLLSLLLLLTSTPFHCKPRILFLFWIRIYSKIGKIH